MIIDDILAYCDLDFNGYARISNAVVFKINENYESFYSDRELYERMKDEVGTLKIAARLPYSNNILLFDDFILWAVDVSQDDSDEYAIVCTGGYNQDYKTHVAKGGKQVPYGFLYVFDKTTLECTKLMHFMGRKLSEGSTEEQLSQVRAAFGVAVAKFLNFLSCKNIRTIANDPPEKVQKKRKKQGKKPLISYYTLELKQAKSYESEGNKNLWSNRIHLCRGHFREYTEDKPLFGKLVGRYWIPPHARGNKREGVIYKDYSIKEEEAA